MTFGLRNAAQSFLDSLFRDLPNCFVYIDRLKPCFFADPTKPTSVDKSSTSITSPSIVSAAPHHSQQGTFEQSSKLRVRFAEFSAQYVIRSGRAVHPSRRFT
ncbi:hypothetical protein TNIN_379011 [Trichonephila inaurata madagascariensis]|uniref:Uncharacterized protein n=1 Tax=Trichonephila inaurata madagascariensis TaxID=2747483 RepID=A0A8X6WUI3_9ARAC|nr:hypothetical protein TNIN_379011 [Trichonephila inaurata madagascariensis]